MPFNNVDVQTFKVADGDAIGKGRFVINSDADTVVQAGDGDDAIGVAFQNKTANDGRTTMSVYMLGSGKLEVVAGAAIDASSARQPIASDANGRAKVATSGDAIIARSYESAAASGDIITIVGLGASRQV